MLKAVKYSSKKVTDVSMKNIKLNNGYYWIDSSKPNQKELESLQKLLGISLHDLKNALDNKEVPRGGNRANYSFVIFKSATSTSTSTIGMFISNNYILTVHKDVFPELRKLQSSFELPGKSFSRNDLSLIMYQIMFFITKEYAGKLVKVGESIEKIDSKIFKRAKESDVQELFTLKKQLLYYSKALSGNENVVDDIIQLKYLSKASRDSFSRLHVEIKQVNSVLELYRERLVESMNLYMSSLSNKLNDIMKGFTVIATLVLLPTLISGIWGMNFAEIPWFGDTYGFYYPIALMLLSTFLLLWFFRRKGWL
tara:strand:- start:7722 stop:8651 length:930 start_codon:yes stop_codon:yes gene_type:complete